MQRNPAGRVSPERKGGRHGSPRKSVSSQRGAACKGGWTYAVTKYNTRGQTYPGSNPAVDAAFKARANWKHQRFDTPGVNVLWVGKSKTFWWDRWRRAVPGKLQLVNKFRFNTELSTKDKMIRHLRRYCFSRDIEINSITPCTFILGARSDEAEHTALLEAAAADPSLLWIVKPAALRGGKGIQVMEAGPAAAQILEYTASDNSTTWVVQQYIERPLLTLEGHKFDVRMYVVLDRKMQLWLFPEGYLRVSSKPYTYRENLADAATHVLNGVIQQADTECGADEFNNVRDWDEFHSILAAHGADPANIWHQSVHIALHCFKSVEEAFKAHSRWNDCFELFALDLIVSEAFEVTLLEVNQDPWLFNSDPHNHIAVNLIPKMLGAAFNVLFDDDFPSAQNSSQRNSEFVQIGQMNDIEQ